jgi:hypothetical protein
MTNYKQWILVAKKELNGIAVDYADPEGNHYSEPFCFPTLDEALSYGRICIDRLIEAKSSHQKSLFLTSVEQ